MTLAQVLISRTALMSLGGLRDSLLVCERVFVSAQHRACIVQLRAGVCETLRNMKLHVSEAKLHHVYRKKMR